MWRRCLQLLHAPGGRSGFVIRFLSRPQGEKDYETMMATHAAVAKKFSDNVGMSKALTMEFSGLKKAIGGSDDAYKESLGL